MGSMVVLDSLPFEIKTDKLFHKLHLKPGEEYLNRVNELLEEVWEIARPKGLYREAAITDRGEDYVVIEGIRFESRILRVNLEEAYRVFPYLVTVGTELDGWAESVTDLLEKYWVDQLQEIVLHSATSGLFKDLNNKYHPGSTAGMNPGSLKDWPLPEQENLFKLLDSREIGVRLTDSYLMLPRKTVSGIRFPTEVNFENCQLCSRPDCPGRSAPYNRELLKKYDM